MPAVGLPDEPQRLEAVARYTEVTLPRDLRLDRITRLVAWTFEVSVASLIEEDWQHFQACYGIDGAEDLSRELAFCSHVIRFDEVLVVEGTIQDERLADHPMVAGPPTSVSTPARRCSTATATVSRALPGRLGAARSPMWIGAQRSVAPWGAHAEGLPRLLTAAAPTCMCSLPSLQVHISLRTDNLFERSVSAADGNAAWYRKNIGGCLKLAERPPIVVSEFGRPTHGADWWRQQS